MKKALVVAMVMVFGLGALAFAGPLSGSWKTEICIGGIQTGPLTIVDFESDLTVNYSVCGWEFVSESEFEVTGWDEQSFSVEGIAGAFTFASYLEFSPMLAAFDAWDTSAGVSIAGVQLDGRFVLLDGGAGWVLSASQETGLCVIEGTVFFNSWPYVSSSLWNQYAWGITPQIEPGYTLLIFPDYCFCFTYAEFSATFPFCCLEEVEATIGFSMFGLEDITFALSGVEMPGFSWITWDIELTFDDGIGLGKELTLTPSTNFGDSVCLDFYVDLVIDNNMIDGLSLWGLGLECDMGQGVTVSSMSVLDWPNHAFWGDDPYYLSYGVLTVDDMFGTAIQTVNLDDLLADPTLGNFTDLVDLFAYLCCETYWEKFSIATSADACCGGAFEFGIDVYFGAESNLSIAENTYVCIHPWLFDVARIDANFSVGLGSNFGVSGGIVLEDKNYIGDGLCELGGLTEICVGFEVSF